MYMFLCSNKINQLMSNSCPFYNFGLPPKDIGPSNIARPDTIVSKNLNTCRAIIGDLTVTGTLTASNIPTPSPLPPIPQNIQNILTVTVDGPTIQSCIDLCQNPTSTNVWIVRIPPGSYTEDLNLRGSVCLQGMGNPGDSLTVNVYGIHTLVGNGASPLDNRVTIANIHFSNSFDPTNPQFNFSSTNPIEVYISGCFLENYNPATTAKLLQFGPNVVLYMNNIRSRMYGITNQGGTHIIMNGGGQLYLPFGYDASGGSRFLLMQATVTTTFARITGALIAIGGPDIASITTNNILSGNITSNNNVYQNYAPIGNGIILQNVNASMVSSFDYYDIREDPTTYVIKGVVGTAFVSNANTYANIPLAQVRNVKIQNNINILAFTSTLTPSP